MSRRAALSIAALAFGACVVSPQIPGDLVMGTFQFAALREIPPTGGSACPYEELDAGVDGGGTNFSFSATFSQMHDTSQAWVSLNGAPREAVFDGQRVQSEAAGTRTLSSCGQPDGGCLP